MRRVWICEDYVVLGGIGTSWRQRWGLSRDRRTGAWTLYDRRDGSICGDPSGMGWERYPTTEALLDEVDGGELQLDRLVDFLEARADPDLAELWLAARSRLGEVADA